MEDGAPADCIGDRIQIPFHTNDAVRHMHCWRRCKGGDNTNDVDCSSYDRDVDKEGENSLCGSLANLEALCLGLADCHSVTMVAENKGYLNGHACTLTSLD